ncbi:MAG: hypothetical protein AB7O96_11945 [Pseudobdellovibrionaceae bacterium]
MKTSNLKKSRVMAGTLTSLLCLVFAGCSNKLQAVKQQTIAQSKVFGDTTVVRGFGSDGGSVATGAGADGGLVIVSSNQNNSAPVNNSSNNTGSGSDSGANSSVAGSGSDSGADSSTSSQNSSTVRRTRGQGADGGSTTGTNPVQTVVNTDYNGTGSDGGGASTQVTAPVGSDGGTSAPPPVVTSPRPQVVAPITNGRYNVHLVCSSGLGYSINLSKADSATVRIKDQGTGNSCQLAGDQKATLKTGSLDLTACFQELRSVQGLYTITVTDSMGRSLMYDENPTISSDLDNRAVGITQIIAVVADINHDYTPEENLTNHGVTDLPDPSINCSYNASPLVINFTEAGQYDPGLLLIDPMYGIMFDILGKNADPFPHAKQKISWPRNSNYMFLAVKGPNGKIEGVDQLFGDNTFGPDGQFAKHGFAALAKHDDNGDKYIDAKDRIFSQLVVWSDRNRNAVSGEREMRSLESMGVERIDLLFDPNYYDRDIYGNESKYKSIVIMKDGSNRLLFDLWFRAEK